MSFLLLVLFAFLTKTILESPLVKGELGFFKTYFIFGGVLTFAVAFIIMYFGILNVADIGPRGVEFKLTGLVKALLTMASFYYLMLIVALYNVAKKATSDAVKVASYFFMVVLAISVCFGLTVSFVSGAMYVVLLFIIYKFVWKKDLVQELKSTITH